MPEGLKVRGFEKSIRELFSIACLSQGVPVAMHGWVPGEDAIPSLAPLSEYNRTRIIVPIHLPAKNSELKKRRV